MISDVPPPIVPILLSLKIRAALYSSMNFLTPPIRASAQLWPGADRPKRTCVSPSGKDFDNFFPKVQKLRTGGYDGRGVHDFQQ